MALVYNCNDDVAAVAFISGLQLTHSFYKHLVKHEVTKMRDILTHARSIFKLRILPKVLPTLSQARGQSGETEGAACSSEEDFEPGSQSCQQARS